MAFITLAEFLNLADPRETKYFRSAWCIRPRPEEWVKYYEAARESFEQYGEAGPPVGRKVITFQPGHGGGAGVVRVFDGVFPRDERCFQIYRTEDSHYSKGERLYSLVDRSIWWSAIAVIDDSLYNYREFEKKWGFLGGC